jgi:hypothetical protein
MDKRFAEVFHVMGEFLSERAMWTSFCEAAVTYHGLTPKQIAEACNAAAEAAGYSGGLEPEDCT